MRNITKTKYSIGDTVYLIPSKGPSIQSTMTAVDSLLAGITLVTGVVYNIYKSEDRSYHGSPVYETIYEMQNSIGNRYTTNSEEYGHVNILYKSEIIEAIRRRIKGYDNKINEIQRTKLQLKYIETELMH